MNEKTGALVSAIIATYNSEKVLEKTLQALRNQTYPQELIEILVMDGMSSDNTRNIASKYDCRIIDNPKVEQGNAKILGMQNAKGKYVLFVDSDEVLEYPEAIKKTVEAFEKEKDCHYAVCSGYKKPDDYPDLSGYISDLGDPFSFFVYRCPKDYRFYSDYLHKNFKISNENNDYFIFDCDLNKKFVLIEGGCGGAMMDMEYFGKYIPKCRTRIADLYHCFYQMCERGDTKVLYMKNDPLAHYSSDKVSGYFRKLRWRVCNNIHFQEKGEEVFSGREKFEKKNHLKKYFFIPYGLIFIIPFLHSLPYAFLRKNKAYLWHCVFAFYVVIQIIYQYILKMLHITPAFVAYGSKDKINNKSENNEK